MTCRSRFAPVASLEELLELNQVAVGIFEDKGVDAERFDVLRPAPAGDAGIPKPTVPAVNVIGDNGYHAAVGLDDPPVDGFADTDKPAFGNPEDPCCTAVADLFEPELGRIELTSRFKVVGVDPSDELLD